MTVSFVWFLLLLLAGLDSAQANDTFTIRLPWCRPSSGSYERRRAREGDTVEFDWNDEESFHNALIYPSGDCSDSGGSELVSDAPGASYTFQPADAGTSKTFVCSAGDHCAKGQIVVFDVLAASDAATFDYLLSSPCGETGRLQKDSNGNGESDGDSDGNGDGDSDGDGDGDNESDSDNESAGGRVAAGGGVAAVTAVATTTAVLSLLW